MPWIEATREVPVTSSPRFLDPADRITLATLVWMATMSGPLVIWWNGASEQVMDSYAWWDGAVEQPAIIEGWWDGAVVQPLA